MYGATIGKTAILGVPAATNQACAVLTEINSNLVLSEYLWEYIKYHSEKLKSMAYGSAQSNINAGIISDFILILPPITIQKKMVKRIAIMRSQIEELHKKQKNFFKQRDELSAHVSRMDKECFRLNSQIEGC